MNTEYCESTQDMVGENINDSSSVGKWQLLPIDMSYKCKTSQNGSYNKREE